jgi:hypothetical protein
VARRDIRELQCVVWDELRETQQSPDCTVGFAALNPPYKLQTRFVGRDDVDYHRDQR